MRVAVLLLVAYWCPSRGHNVPCEPTVFGKPFAQFVEDKKCDIDERLLKLFGDHDTFSKSILSNPYANVLCVGFIEVFNLSPEESCTYDTLADIPGNGFCEHSKIKQNLLESDRSEVFSNHSNVVKVSSYVLEYCDRLCSGVAPSELCWAFGKYVKLAIRHHVIQASPATQSVEDPTDAVPQVHIMHAGFGSYVKPVETPAHTNLTSGSVTKALVQQEAPHGQPVIDISSDAAALNKEDESVDNAFNVVSAVVASDSDLGSDGSDLATGVIVDDVNSDSNHFDDDDHDDDDDDDHDDDDDDHDDDDDDNHDDDDDSHDEFVNHDVGDHDDDHNDDDDHDDNDHDVKDQFVDDSNRNGGHESIEITTEVISGSTVQYDGLSDDDESYYDYVPTGHSCLVVLLLAVFVIAGITYCVAIYNKPTPRDSGYINAV